MKLIMRIIWLCLWNTGEIVEKWTFEDLIYAYEHPIPIDVIQKLCDDYLKELDAELDAIADAVNAEVEAGCEAEDDEGDI